MSEEITNLINRKPKIIIAKNQEALMDIFIKFPGEEFTQHELHEQTQIKYPASVHSALMALVKKTKIDRVETEGNTRTHITYKLCRDVTPQPVSDAAMISGDSQGQQQLAGEVHEQRPEQTVDNTHATSQPQ